MSKLTDKWSALSRVSKAIIIGLSAFILISALGHAHHNNAVDNPENPGLAPQSTSSLPQTREKAPTITKQTVTETKVIPHDSTTVNSDSISKGTSKVTTQGSDGVETLTYEVTYSDNVESSRKLVSDQVTTQPVTEVTTVGTYAAPSPAASSNCDPNYSGACVPIASDVDCAGGGGNGPAYVRGSVYVIGRDIYGLDRDGNGVGCE